MSSREGRSNHSSWQAHCGGEGEEAIMSVVAGQTAAGRLTAAKVWRNSMVSGAIDREERRFERYEPNHGRKEGGAEKRRGER